MARPLRFIPPGAVVEVTTRTIHGRFLLRPSTEVNDVVLGVLGRAQRLFGVELHAFIVLSNHMHLLCSVRDAAQLAAFMAFLNGNIARKVGRLQHWRERFWGRRYRAIVVADEAAQVERLRYILQNGVKEGLVPSPKCWPGCSSVTALTTGTPIVGIWRDGSSERRGEQRPRDSSETGYPVTLSPLPCWRDLTVAAQRRACSALVTEIESDSDAVTGGETAGATAIDHILQTHPHDAPPHSKSGPAPFVHATSSAVRRAFRAAYEAFAEAYYSASARLRRGERAVEFPEAAFPPAPPFIPSAVHSGF